jgi:DNA invertase Pin-like site-specific DNA recombinase
VDFGGKVFDSTDLMADFFITVMSAIAQLEIDRTSKRIKDVLNGKFARGESLGGRYAPYGYDKVLNGQTRMKKDGTVVHIKVLVNNEEEQDALRQMKQLQAQGMSARAIKEWLNENGIPTKSGQAWTVSRTDKVLRSAHTARLWNQWSRE